MNNTTTIRRRRPAKWVTLIIIIIIVSVFATIALIQVCTIAVLKGIEDAEYLPGRDTVKQWDSGKYEILRGPTDYSFMSRDGSISIYGVTHYSQTDGDIYLLTDTGQCARVNIVTGEYEICDSAESAGMSNPEKLKEIM